MVKQWNCVVEQWNSVEQCGETLEQCGTLWNSIVEQYGGPVWNIKVEEWKCGAGNSGTVL